MNDSPEIPTKATLRAEARTRLRSIDANALERASAEICRRLLAHDTLSRAERTLLFAPMRGEIDLREVGVEWLCRGVQVAIPHCDFATGTMLAALITDWDLDITLDERGVPGHRVLLSSTPTQPQIIVPQVVVTPGLAFDVSGGRLGRGAGFYDRFLARWRLESRSSVARVIGVSLDEQIIDRVPIDAFDELVDEIVTPTRVIVTAKRA
ncbi:MAG: 5-formyltetrahydrofolate cyclo-ligase [Phycisphaerales bacterium]|nr:MAG: 5-formyltetrahydrofolate cyclo-ligase [Phycisphaerales bacterium]